MLLCVGCETALAADQLPTVGCRADGQGGPIGPPTHITHVPMVSQPAAQDLAYYASEGLGVVAPRGWHCFGLYGSNGTQLIVTPEKHNVRDLIPSAGLRGPAVYLTYANGSTSGRFTVARVVARLFPADRWYVQRVIEEGIEPEDQFPVGPYRDDILTRRSDTEVEFQTPANIAGIGTQSRLIRNSDPITGVVILLPQQDMDLVQLFVRMPPDMIHLAPAIITSVESQKSLGQIER